MTRAQNILSNNRYTKHKQKTSAQSNEQFVGSWAQVYDAILVNPTPISQTAKSLSTAHCT
jgi:hypothetical protein